MYPLHGMNYYRKKKEEKNPYRCRSDFIFNSACTREVLSYIHTGYDVLFDYIFCW